MKKYILVLILGACSLVNAQGARGPKIGYFDMNRILKSVPEFAEANNQLELKAQAWKREIDDRQAQINLLIEELKTERVLLTKELIEEKEDEIAFLQKELSDYQQKRFGPIGDLFTQKAVLVKPIQDQVFTIVNDIVERRNYDFVYDMSSASNGLIFASQRYDMNDEIINAITRASKRDQAERRRMSKEEEQAEDDKKYDPDLRQKEEERQAKIDERQQKIDERREAQEQKRQEQIERRQKQLEERSQSSSNSEEVSDDDKPVRSSKEEREALIEQRKQQIQEQREARQREREQKIADRQREIEERKNNRNQSAEPTQNVGDETNEE